jgi:hypothetical protein
LRFSCAASAHGNLVLLLTHLMALAWQPVDAADGTSEGALRRDRHAAWFTTSEAAAAATWPDTPSCTAGVSASLPEQQAVPC